MKIGSSKNGSKFCIFASSLAHELHRHMNLLSEPCDGASDGPCTEHEDPSFEEPFRITVFPLVAPLKFERVREIFRKCEEKAKYVFGDGVVEDATRIRNLHTAFGQFAEQDAVDTRSCRVNPAERRGALPLALQ